MKHTFWIRSTLGLCLLVGCRDLLGIDDLSHGSDTSDAAGGVTHEPHGAAGDDPRASGGSSSGKGGGPVSPGGTSGGGGRGCDLTDETEDVEFDSELGCWRTFNLDKISHQNIDRTRGVLMFTPVPKSAWYNQDTGSFLYRALEGDFVVETSVNVVTARSAWSGGALMVYDPASKVDDKDTYYLIGVGSLDAPAQRGIKTEWTFQRFTKKRDKLPFEGPARLRLCRVGPLLYMAYASIGADDWRAFDVFDSTSPSLPDLPDRVFVGFTATQYPDSATPTSQSEFDYFRIRQGNLEPADCIAPLMD